MLTTAIEKQIKAAEMALEDLVTIIRHQDFKIDDLKENKIQRDKNTYHLYGFRAVKKILYYITKGIEENKALHLTYYDFKDCLTVDHIKTIWSMSRASKSGLILYGRVYAAKKMKAAGFKITDISKALNLSNQTIHKLLKETCITEKEDV